MYKKAMKVLASVRRPVLVAHQHGCPSDTTLALMVCASCETEVLTNYSEAPVCPICSSQLTPAPNVVSASAKGKAIRTLTLSEKDLKRLPVIAHCQNCGCDHRTEASLGTSLAGTKFHCVVCASDIEAEDEPEPAEEDATEEEENEDELDSGSSDELPSKQRKKDAAPATDEEEDDYDTGNTPEEEDLDSDSSSSGMTDEEYSEGIRIEASDEMEDEDEDEDELSDEEPEEDDTIQEEPEPTPRSAVGQGCKKSKTSTVAEKCSPPPAAVTANLLQVNAFDQVKDKEVELHMVKAGLSDDAAWYLFANNRPVAVSTRQKVTASLKPVFDSPAFGRAFTAASAEGVTQEVIDNFGLEPVIVEQPVDTAVTQKIEAAVAKKVKRLNKEITEVRASFEQCVGIAAVGVNKGFFGDVKSPLRQGMIEALSSVNVRNPERLVDRVFAKHSNAHMKAIVAKAGDLQKKSRETLEEIATLVDEADFKSDVPKSEEVADNLSKGSLPLTVTASLDEHAESPSDMRRLFRGLGKRAM